MEDKYLLQIKRDRNILVLHPILECGANPGFSAPVDDPSCAVFSGIADAELALVGAACFLVGWTPAEHLGSFLTTRRVRPDVSVPCQVRQRREETDTSVVIINFTSIWKQNTVK